MSDDVARSVRFIAHINSLLTTIPATLTTPLFMSVPSAFWSAPASSSGKYHPDYALGDGGLLRHTLVCVHIARDIAPAYALTDPIALDTLTLAAAFHDTYKGGDTGIEPWTETVKDHPTLAKNRLVDMTRDVKDLSWDAIILRFAALAVGSHMSMWGPTAEPIDSMARVAQIVSVADYMASRKYLEPSADLAELLRDFA